MENSRFKFRAWDGKKQIMYEPNCIELMIHFNGELQGMTEKGGVVGTYNMPKMELMQFTGLKDKNGKDIYECDIVNIFFRDETFITRQIVWYRDGWKTQLLPKPCGCCNKAPSTENYGSWSRMEVIGNIYENPELIERS